MRTGIRKSLKCRIAREKSVMMMIEAGTSLNCVYDVNISLATYSTYSKNCAYEDDIDETGRFTIFAVITATRPSIAVRPLTPTVRK